jgi:hypothetical protein
MQRLLARRIGPDTVAKLEAAVSRRLAEAALLHQGGQGLGAIYLCGIAIEICLATAYFRVIGFRPNTEITESIRRLAITSAIPQRLMGRTPHDLWGWAQFLVVTKKRRSSGDREELRLDILRHARLAYARWRPNLRYRAIVPTSSEVSVVIESARWFDSHYAELWR